MHKFQIVALRAEHEAQLADLFNRISSDPLREYFHPHPFTHEQAATICLTERKDLYLGLLINEAIVAYGFLRGWDEGYKVPSLGLYIAPEMRGRGAAQSMMTTLHLLANMCGAENIMLKVYRSNQAACKLYLSFGYDLKSDPEQPTQLIGTYQLRQKS